jgi:aminopeptidase-like protein
MSDPHDGPWTRLPEGVGEEMWQLAATLYPLCRSITGEGLRATLAEIRRRIPLELQEVPTGTPVLDWTVPREWNVRDAWIATPDGRRIVDFRQSNLHVVSYSIPVRRRMRRAELEEHLYSLPEQPDWVPYRTSYYAERWGFCLSERTRRSLVDPEYDVCIDSTLEDGTLTYGELVLQGALDDEVLISCHCCHPSLANDNLSGIAVATYLARALSGQPLRYSYRFLFAPGTIGAITWLALNEPRIPRIKHGLVLACLGDPGPSTYKRSRRGDAEIDRAVAHVLRHDGAPSRIVDFTPYGYDERQYCSPGFDLPVGSLMRTPHGQYPEYHTSADDLSLVRPEALADSLAKLLAVVHVLEHNRRYRNLHPRGEPQLGRRGLYRQMGGVKNATAREHALLWVLNLSDGDHTLLDIAERAGLFLPELAGAAAALMDAGLLEEIPASG